MIQLVFCPERQILGELTPQGIKEIGSLEWFLPPSENLREVVVEDEDFFHKVLDDHREFVEIIREVSPQNAVEASAKDHLTDLLYANTAIPRFVVLTLTKGESYTQVEWAETPTEVFNPKRRRKTSLAKFLRKAVHKGWINFSEEVIQAASEMMGRNFAPGRFSFEEVSGREICEAYGSGPYSCMAGTDMVRLYAANPAVVSLLKIYDGEKYMGRALIWETDQGKTVLDRIYPSDGGLHIKAAIEYAKSNGWLYKTEQSIGSQLSEEGYFSVTLRTYKEGVYDKYVHGYPYMDTFRFTNDIEGDVIQLNNKDGRYILDSTDGGPIIGVACCACGDSFSEEDGSWIDGDFYCEDCRDDLFVWSDAEDEFIYREDAVYCEYCDDYHHENNTVYVEYIDESVCERCLHRNFTQCEECGEWIPDGESEDYTALYSEHPDQIGLAIAFRNDRPKARALLWTGLTHPLNSQSVDFLDRIYFVEESAARWLENWATVNGKGLRFPINDAEIQISLGGSLIGNFYVPIDWSGDPSDYCWPYLDTLCFLRESDGGWWLCNSKDSATIAKLRCTDGGYIDV